jgi:hypothetical protein
MEEVLRKALKWRMLLKSMRGKVLPRRDSTHKSFNGLHKFPF